MEPRPAVHKFANLAHSDGLVIYFLRPRPEPPRAYRFVLPRSILPALYMITIAAPRQCARPIDESPADPAAAAESRTEASQPPQTYGEPRRPSARARPAQYERATLPAASLYRRSVEFGRHRPQQGPRFPKICISPRCSKIRRHPVPGVPQEMPAAGRRAHQCFARPQGSHGAARHI